MMSNTPITLRFEGGFVELDFIQLERQLRLLEDSAGIVAKNGTVKPNEDFLASVALWLRKQGLKHATNTTAWQLWWAVFSLMESLRERTRTMAELAHWFSVDPFKLSATDRLGLLANLETVKAQDRIHRGDYDPTDYQTIYALYKLAFDDEELAQRQKSAALERYVDKCVRNSKR